MKAKLITYKGKTQSVTAWAKEYGITSGGLNSRLKRGWDIEKALTAPSLSHAQKWEYKGKLYTAKELSILHGGVSESTMLSRLQTMTPEEAMSTPNRRPHRKVRITEEQQKQMFKPKPHVPDTTQCRTCQYRAKDMTCGYSIVTHKCRMFISPPSPNCKVYVKGNSIVQEAVRRSMGKVRV